MHFASYNIRGRSSFGIVAGDGVIDLRLRLPPHYASLLDVLRAGTLDDAKAAVSGVRADYPLSEVELLPPDSPVKPIRSGSTSARAVSTSRARIASSTSSAVAERRVKEKDRMSCEFGPVEWCGWSPVLRSP